MIRPSVVGAIAACILLAGCSSDPTPSTRAQEHGARTTSATHWWTGTDYCAVLRQTMRGGDSILAGAKAGDPELLTATKEFVAELTASAPDGVREQWRVLGPALTQLVGSGGKLAAVSGVEPRQVSAAATGIAADAKTRCHVDVSAT